MLENIFTPLTVFVSIAVIAIIFHYGYSMMKGNLPSMFTCSSLCCLMMSSICMISTASKFSSMMGWVIALFSSMCAIYFVTGNFTFSKIY
jgi:chromate transport protein ChrA